MNSYIFKRYSYCSVDLDFLYILYIIVIFFLFLLETQYLISEDRNAIWCPFSFFIHQKKDIVNSPTPLVDCPIPKQIILHYANRQ